MDFVKKPNKKEQFQNQNTKQVNDVIRKGGKTTRKNNQKAKRKKVQQPIRLYGEQFTIIDNLLPKYPKISRHKWIIEAIVEKLERIDSDRKEEFVQYFD